MALEVTVISFGTINRYQQYLKYHVGKDIQDPHGIPGHPRVEGDWVVIIKVQEGAILHEGLLRLHGLATDESNARYHSDEPPTHYYADWWKPTDEQKVFIQNEAGRILMEWAEDQENPQDYTGKALRIVATYRRVKEWLGISEFELETLRWIRIPLSRNPRLRWARHITWKRIFWILVGMYILAIVIHYVRKARIF